MTEINFKFISTQDFSSAVVFHKESVFISVYLFLSSLKYVLEDEACRLRNYHVFGRIYGGVGGMWGKTVERKRERGRGRNKEGEGEEKEKLQ